MVKKFLRVFNREYGNIHEAAFLLGLFAFLSQILGLFRDRALAHYLGAGPTLDVYYAAFRIPDFLYVSVASLASVTVLIPFLSERLSRGGDHADARRFLNSVYTVFFGSIVIVSLILFVLMPYLASYLAPGFSPEQLHMMVGVSRIMLLSPLFLGLSNLIGSITQVFKKFFVYALSPLCYNLGILIGILCLYPAFGLSGLAAGVVIGAVLHFVIQIPTVVRAGYFPRFTRNIDWNEIRSVVAVSLPRTLTLSLTSLVMLVFLSLASRMQPGSISVFTFSLNLQAVPLGIIGISYTVAAFPTMVATFAKESREKFFSLISVTARHIMFWSMPVVAIFIVLRAQIVRVVLGTGMFSWPATRLTAAILAILMVGIIAQSLRLLLIKGYYASGNTKTPLLADGIGSIVTIFLGFLAVASFWDHTALQTWLAALLRVSDVAGTNILILALAYAVGVIFNFFCLVYVFKRDFPEFDFGRILRSFITALGASCILGIVTYASLGMLAPYFDQRSFYGIFFEAVLAGVVGIVVWGSILVLAQNREFREVRQALTRRFWKTEVVAPEQREL